MTGSKDIKTESKRKFHINPVTRFVLIFLISILIISIGFSQLFTRYHDNFLWLMDSTASICGWTMSIFTDQVSYSDRFITYNGFPVEIIDECTGLFEVLIYLAAVLSFSTSIRNKSIGLLMGIPAIYLFNIIRIIMLLIAGSYSQRAFDFLHLYLWQVILIIMISTVWVGWLYLVVYREKRSKNISA
ncbi:MAG: exosortase H [Candidatus Zixiibacteriota bacterium]